MKKNYFLLKKFRPKLIFTLLFVLSLFSNHHSVGQPSSNKPFITKWDLSISGSGDTQIIFNSSGITDGTVNFTWTTVETNSDLVMNGSGTFENTTTLSTKTISGLPAGKTILLSIFPTNFNQLQINQNADKNRLLDVTQWGEVAWSSMVNAFAGCSNLNITSIDKPDLRNVLKMDAMFSFCSTLNGPANINSWDISNVQSIREMFYYASAFNQPLNDWNANNVRDMGHIFSSASSFNQALNNWQVDNVLYMTSMFFNATKFNQPINNWNVSKVIDMFTMFGGATEFNQPLNLWNVSQATNMKGMFFYATNFNQSLENWQFNPSVELSQFLDFSGLSVDNYDALLQALSGSTLIGKNMGAVNLRYCNSVAARMNLINVKGWTITGDISNVPVISSQPVSSTIISGNSATFSVVASGTDLTYQWQEKIAMGEFMNIINATNASYTIPTTTLAQNGNQYRVIITQGACSVTSDIATLTVNPAIPIITSFSPLSGPVGTVVTISGKDFNTNTLDNIVYFGGMKAVVKSATTITLEVEVPYGATYQNLSVTNLSSNRTGYSNKPFIVSNAGDFVFSPQKKLTTPTNANPSYTATADLDNDGKLDIINANYNDASISVFRNTSTKSMSSFSPGIRFISGARTNHVFIADIDGDGKQDAITVNELGNSISILRNTSSTGTINFADKIDFSTGNTPYSVAIGDLNNDGKPDLAVSNFQDNSITIYLNTSTVGLINLSYSTSSISNIGGLQPWALKIRDIDNDGINDIITTNFGSNNLSIFKNTLTNGIVSFASPNTSLAANAPNAVIVDDIDKDGFLDIAVTNTSTNQVSIFKNITTNNAINFAPKKDIPTETFPYSLDIADFDGDGLLDLAVANGVDNSISVFRNTTDNDGISFSGKGLFSTYLNPYSVSTGDLNNDGKADLISGNFNGKNVSYLLQGSCNFTEQEEGQDNALNFDGINDHVEIANCATTPLPVKDEITIEYWFKGSNMQSAVRFQTDRDYIVMGWQNNRHIISTDGGLNGLFFGANVTDGKWHHIAMTWKKGAVASGNGFRSYVDGRLANSRDVNTNINLPVIRTNFQLGSFLGSQEFTNGSLDEVRVWNIARTEAQIAENMKKSPSDQSGLLIYYKFNHGTASGDNSGITQIKNEISNSSYTGYLTDFTLTGSSSNFVAPSPKNTRWYVKTDGGDDNKNGESWNTAFKTLKMATAQAIKGDEIWVAKGIYYPDEGPNTIDNDRTSSFKLVNGVAIYGGFSGNETLLSERNFKLNKTTLSGDLQKNDTQDFYSNKSDNAYHVMVNNAVDASTLLDGFTISGGYSDDSAPERFGGAMLNKGLTNEGREANFNPTFRNLIIESNYAGSRGGGVCNIGSFSSFGSMNPTFENCVFFDNRTGGQGGAMANINFNHNLKVRNSVFVSNAAVSKGNAFLGEYGNFEFTHVTFYKNLGSEPGKVISVINNAKGTINNSIISSENGSAISTENSATIQLNNSIYGDGNYDGTLLLPTNVSGDNNLDANPQFLNTENLKGADNLWGTNDDGLNLRSCSPAINLGTNILVTDITGAIRPYSTTLPDAGAYEFRDAKLSISASSNTPVCEGKNIILSTTLSGSAQTMSWMGPNSFTSTTGIVENVSANNAGIYTVSLTTLDGCTATATTSVTVTIIPIPVINIPAQTSVCQPEKITLTATQCEGTITWFNETTGSTLTLTEAKTYTVTATCTVENCTSKPSEALMIEIKQKPMPPTINPPTQKVVCQPNTLTLTASNCEGTISWNNGASTGTSFTLNEVNTYTVSATCTVNGCTSDESEQINGLQIKQKPMPPTINPPAQKVVCQPNTLTPTASNCAGTVTWSEAGVTGTSLTLTSVGTYSISATCTVNGCTSDKSESINGLQIKVKPMPPVIEGTKNVCTPESITLNATGCLGTITWSDGVTSSTRIISDAGTYKYTATCTENGCISESSNESTSVIYQSPKKTTIIPNQSNICQGNSITLVTFCPNMQVVWSNGSSGSSINVNPVNTTSYTATCVDKNGCISPSSEEAQVVVEAQPTQPIITASSNAVCSGNGITLSASLCDNGNGTLHWTNNQVGNSIYVTPSKTSKYRVACISVFGCISDSSDVFIPVVIDIPNSPTVENKYVSKGNVTTLSATCSSGTPVWYESSYSRTSIAIGSLTTPIILTNKTYYVACETAPDSPVNCSSIGRSTQTVIVDNFFIISQPSHTYVCSGQNAVFKINVSGVSVMYQWQEYIDDSWINIENNKIYSGTNTSILQLLAPPLNFDGKIYRCLVTNTLTDGTPAQFISDEVSLAVKASALAQNLIMVSPLLGITNIYQAVKTINASNKILSKSKISYFAGNSITLNPGFEVSTGSVFQVKVQQTCTNTSFKIPDTITK